jgi:hypothetical protein
MRFLLTVLIGSLVLAAAPVAAAKPSIRPGVYRGKVTPGSSITIRVSSRGRVKFHGILAVDCSNTPYPGTPTTGDTERYGISASYEDVKVKARRFSFSDEELLSGTGGESATSDAEGTFRGTSVSGTLDYDDSWNTEGGGASGSCSGSATFTARLAS